MNRLVILIFFNSCLFLASCKKDSPSQPALSFSIKNLGVDGQQQQASYTNVSLTPKIIISFSAPVNRSTAPGQIMLTGPSQVVLNFDYSNSDSTLTISPTAPLIGWNSYRLMITTNLISTTNLNLNSTVSISLGTQIDPTDKFPRISDDALLDLVQQTTLKYFYDFGEPNSGMAHERNTSGNTVTTGGSGFGLMAMVAGIDRGFIPRNDGIARFAKIIGFLEKADRFHGAWSHWIDGTTGKVIPFSALDDGADLVETSYMAQGLLTTRQYLTADDTVGNNLINRITTLYNTIEWDWFRNGDTNNVLIWHWSPDNGFKIDFQLSGYFEEQITYLMAASSPTHGIPKIVYSNGFGQNGAIATNKTFTYNGESYVLPLGSPSPLFWVQYSYLGLNPHFSDDYANYWTQNVNASLLDHAYCVQNPQKFIGYSDSCWGLTASDTDHGGYGAQSPSNDNGTISPTAALSSFPYTPTQSMKALQFFYYTIGDRLWGQYGFYDAFDITTGWCANSTLAIDQGPIVVMIENYRSGLLWNLFESAPEVKAGKTVLGFH